MNAKIIELVELLITLTIALLLSFRTIRKISSQMYFAALFSTYLIGAINGTLGVNFRYQMQFLKTNSLIDTNTLY